MLRTVKDQNPSSRSHCGNDVWILWLVSRLVDLSRVINLLLNVHFDCGLFPVGRVSIATNFASLLIIIVRIRGDVLRDLDVCDLEVVLCVV